MSAVFEDLAEVLEAAGFAVELADVAGLVADDDLVADLVVEVVDFVAPLTVLPTVVLT